MNNSLQHLLLCNLVIALSLPAQAVKPTILPGTVTHVRDGDTIEVGSVPIRLNGVSAPELKKPLPAGDVERLLFELPEARGLTVPVMPTGSPGTEMPGVSSDSYEVILFDDKKS